MNEYAAPTDSHLFPEVYNILFSNKGQGQDWTPGLTLVPMVHANSTVLPFFLFFYGGGCPKQDILPPEAGTFYLPVVHAYKHRKTLAPESLETDINSTIF